MQPPEANVKCLSGGPKTFFERYSLKKEEKIFRTVTLKKIVRRIFPHPCLLSPNITNSCFLGPPVANFGPSMTEARGNLSNELAKMLWSFFPPVSGHPDTLQLCHCIYS